MTAADDSDDNEGARPEQVRIRLSVAEKRELQAAARRDGLPLGSWMRSVALKKARAVAKAKSSKDG